MRAFHVYPKRWGLTRPDSNIDHRRVPNLATFFARHGTSLTPTRGCRDYKPGDVVAWALPDGRPHIGLVTERRSSDGKRPLVHAQYRHGAADRGHAVRAHDHRALPLRRPVAGPMTRTDSARLWRRDSGRPRRAIARRQARRGRCLATSSRRARPGRPSERRQAGCRPASSQSLRFDRRDDRARASACPSNVRRSRR